MHKTLNKVLFALLFIVFVAYFLEQRANTPSACKNIQGLWNPVKQVCENTTEQVIYQSLSKPNPVTIEYPENGRPVSLDKVEKIEDIVYLRGHYEVLLSPEKEDKEAVYERGSVYLNMSKMTLLTFNRQGITYFSAPFIINTAGNGVNVYVGLFSYDFNTHQARHLGDELLGERIREVSILAEAERLDAGVIRIDFKSHSTDQTFTDYPTYPSEISLELLNLLDNSDESAEFVRVKRMHSSWDSDNNGVNDCENDGSCDHTFDYSQLRVSQ